MEIVYCMNVCTNEPKLMTSINVINGMFCQPPIFVASNGIDNFRDDVTSNVRFKKWGENQGWQLGALNGALQALNFAAQSLSSINCPVIFSHDDIYPVNKDKIVSLFSYMDDYDVFCRKYDGSASHNSKDIMYPYCMIECMILSPRVLSVFANIKPILELHLNKCAEEMFGYIINSMGLKLKTISIPNNSAMEENEMGFFHNHIEHTFR